MDLTIYRSVRMVEVRQSQNNRTYWVVTDDTGQEWKAFQAGPAVACNNAAGTGQLMQLGVQVAPARDPQYGMNYTLRTAMPAPQGAQPTPAGAEHQQAAPMPGQAMQMPGMGQPMTPQAPQAMQMPQQPVPMAQPSMPQGPIKTMGQGGNFSDLDILRMARSTAVECAAQLAIAFTPDFSDPEGNFDWLRFWLAAEAIQKHITHRAHEGWVPGQEMTSKGAPMTNEQQVLAEVQALPGTVEVPMAPQSVPMGASADNADGGDIDWDNP